MLWIIGIVSAFIALVAFCGIFFYFFTDGWELSLSALIVTIIAVVITIGCFCGLNKIYDMRYQETKQTGEWTLVSLQDNSQLSGQLYGRTFYVRASIDTIERYTFYYKLENGGYKNGKVDAEHTTIFEQDSCTPHIVQHTVTFQNKMPKWLHNTLAFGFGNEQYDTFELYIPKGSLVQDFTLDLK